MNKDIALIKVAPDKLSLPRAPVRSGIRRERSQDVGLPPLAASPPVLVLGEVEGVRRVHARHVHVLASAVVRDRRRRAAPEVNVVGLGVLEGRHVAVARGAGGLPPPAVVAVALGHGRFAVDDLDLGYAGALEAIVVCVLYVLKSVLVLLLCFFYLFHCVEEGERGAREIHTTR